MIYTDKHLHLMCKNINTNFFIFGTSDGKYHLVNDFVLLGSRVFNMTDFITDIDKDHVKSYIVEMFKNHGNIDRENPYTDDRWCCENINDMATVAKNGKPLRMIADNGGFYGF